MVREDIFELQTKLEHMIKIPVILKVIYCLEVASIVDPQSRVVNGSLGVTQSMTRVMMKSMMRSLTLLQETTCVNRENLSAEAGPEIRINPMLRTERGALTVITEH